MEVWCSEGGLSGSGVNVNECSESGVMNVGLMDVGSVEVWCSGGGLSGSVVSGRVV